MYCMCFEIVVHSLMIGERKLETLGLLQACATTFATVQHDLDAASLSLVHHIQVAQPEG